MITGGQGKVTLAGVKKELDVMKVTIDDIDKRLTGVEELEVTVTEILDTLNKIFRWIKGSVPLMVTAAVSAGIVNGKLGAFLNALFAGS